MAKGSGGTRNYSNNPHALENRKTEFDSIMSTGDYRDGYFDKSGGYFVIHKDHNYVIDPQKNKEREGAEKLSKRGYRIYLMGEKSYISGGKKKDGFIEHAEMDMKTINSSGKYTIENVLKSASTQGAEVVILIQNTAEMTKGYVTSQISQYLSHAKGSERGILKEVMVVGMSGNIHRHLI